MYLGQSDSQTKLRRAIPVTDRLFTLLRELEQDKDESEVVFRRFQGWASNISQRFQRLRKKVKGLPENLTTHSLRYTFASHLVMKGVDLSTVAELMGHSTTLVTEHYAYLQPDHKKFALDQLPY